ncbi:D-alanyl-D-alanine carboxypeptidase family protein [Paenibacillus sp. MBLB4367]|uniref:D-alanyl-D-alanine carboxypeptidase family protein n=1 Tax=Paenibacillus sp. MBLB4367 TaxID=3384767 RepID=UPI0039082B4A
MKKWIVAAGCLLLLFAASGQSVRNSVVHAFQRVAGSANGGGSLDAQDITGESAVLMDGKTGELLFAKKESQRMYPASTTKIVTALIALEKGKPDEEVTVGAEVHLKEAGESKAGLKQGQTAALIDLVYAMMLPSGNDAARAVAVHLSRRLSGNGKMSEDECIRYFAKLMNDRAKKAGAKDTNFVNPHGLHDDRHVTTARDLALIAKEAMNNERFRTVVQSAAYPATVSTRGQGTVKLALANTNKLLQKETPYFYAAASGIKTGFTDQAGYCLVSSAVKGNTEVIAVVLHSTAEDVWRDSRLLLENGGRK